MKIKANIIIIKKLRKIVPWIPIVGIFDFKGIKEYVLFKTEMYWISYHLFLTSIPTALIIGRLFFM